MRSEASFAALCGASPIEASSGPRVRHRLNRGANRQANNALWRIATVRLRVHERSIDYAARRRAEGKTRREIIRCLKRHIAREILFCVCSPTRPKSHTATACASSAPDAGSPSTPQPKPSTPTPPASQHSNGASTTTATSPNATSGTSPNSRVDKHRSITVLGTHTLSGQGVTVRRRVAPHGKGSAPGCAASAASSAAIERRSDSSRSLNAIKSESRILCRLPTRRNGILRSSRSLTR